MYVVELLLLQHRNGILQEVELTTYLHVMYVVCSQTLPIPFLHDLKHHLISNV